MTSYKQVIIVRTDLGMSIGKMAVQVAHASLSAIRAADNQNIVEAWFYEYPGQRKIVLAVNSEAELLEYFSAVAVGPDVDWKVDAITSKLKLLK